MPTTVPAAPSDESVSSRTTYMVRDGSIRAAAMVAAIGSGDVGRPAGPPPYP